MSMNKFRWQAARMDRAAFQLIAGVFDVSICVVQRTPEQFRLLLAFRA